MTVTVSAVIMGFYGWRWGDAIEERWVSYSEAVDLKKKKKKRIIKEEEGSSCLDDDDDDGMLMLLVHGA